MKTSKQIVAVSTLLLSVLIFSTEFFAQPVQQNAGQKANTEWYIEATKFEKYVSKTPGVEAVQYRHDALNRLTLYFYSKDDVIFVTLFDVGKKVKVSFKYDKQSEMYVCAESFTLDEFKDAVQKIMDRLDQKK